MRQWHRDAHEWMYPPPASLTYHCVLSWLSLIIIANTGLTGKWRQFSSIYCPSICFIYTLGMNNYSLLLSIEAILQEKSMLVALWRMNLVLLQSRCMGERPRKSMRTRLLIIYRWCVMSSVGVSLFSSSKDNVVESPVSLVLSSLDRMLLPHTIILANWWH